MNTIRTDVKETISNQLISLFEEGYPIVAVDADLTRISGHSMFKLKYPANHVQVGLAEQNAFSVAAGLSSMGKIVFISTFSIFASTRALDQINTSICYNNLNVKIVGTYAGLTSGLNGGTHISLQDIAIFRTIPNMEVFVPADCIELSNIIAYAAKNYGPVYISLAKGPLDSIFNKSYSFEEGKAMLLKEGTDLTLITCGLITKQGIKAVEMLNEEGINVRHLHINTIKPFDKDSIIKAAKETKFIVTAENHSVLGGLGSIVSEIVSSEYPTTVIRMGIDDSYQVGAELEYLLEKNKLNSLGIYQTIMKHRNS